jgi:hypothetical protein
MATTSTLMTAEELLALPDDGIDRELIRGELRGVPTARGSSPATRQSSMTGCLSWLKAESIGSRHGDAERVLPGRDYHGFSPL